MSDKFNEYDPLNVTISFKGIDIQGVAKGTFIKVEREAKTWSKKVGSTGTVTRVRSRDRTGKITITLMNGSPSNDLLMAIYLQDELTGDQDGAFMMRDFSGTTKCKAANAWIVTTPPIERADDASDCVWELECADLSVFAGGNA